jgi:uncharacterized repeat protein (TIGR03803 family)
MKKIAIAAGLALVFASLSFGQYKVFYRFPSSFLTSGQPYGPFVFDVDGNLWGTTPTSAAGTGSGTVFKVSPKGVLTVNHQFLYPKGPTSGLTMDAAGNMYGTSGEGTSQTAGWLWEVTAPPEEKEETLWGFQVGVPSSPGIYVPYPPAGNSYSDPNGFVFDVSQFGGPGINVCGFKTYGCGTVWRYSPEKQVVTSIFNFPTDIGPPFGGNVTQDASGNIYGVNSDSIWQIHPDLTNHSWVFSWIGQFAQGGNDGVGPVGVSVAPDGSIWVTTWSGGNMIPSTVDGCGGVWKLVPQTDGTWTKETVYLFPSPPGSGGEGCSPNSYVVFDAAGNAYGTTSYGGSADWSSAISTVYKISASGNESILHTFNNLTEAFGGQPVVHDDVLYGPASWGSKKPYGGALIWEYDLP